LVMKLMFIKMIGNKLKLGGEPVVWNGNDTVYRGMRFTKCVSENLLYLNLGNVGSGQRKPTSEMVQLLFELLGAEDACTFVRGRSIGEPFHRLKEGKFMAYVMNLHRID
jgi:hypothetical protein